MGQLATNSINPSLFTGKRGSQTHSTDHLIVGIDAMKLAEPLRGVAPDVFKEIEEERLRKSLEQLQSQAPVNEGQAPDEEVASDGAEKVEDKSLPAAQQSHDNKDKLASESQSLPTGHVTTPSHVSPAQFPVS